MVLLRERCTFTIFEAKEALMIIVMDFVLTNDAELRTKLMRKLKEYETRLRYQAPEIDSHATYKRDILKHLLETGEVIAEALMAKAQKRDWFSESSFREALDIISAYNSDNVERLRGGTGLK